MSSRGRQEITAYRSPGLGEMQTKLAKRLGVCWAGSRSAVQGSGWPWSSSVFPRKRDDRYQLRAFQMQDAWHVISLQPHHNCRKKLFLPTPSRPRDQGTEGLRNLPEDTQLESGGARIRTQLRLTPKRGPPGLRQAVFFCVNICNRTEVNENIMDSDFASALISSHWCNRHLLLTL